MAGAAVAVLCCAATVIAGPIEAELFDSGPPVEVMPGTGPSRGTLLFLSGDRGWQRSFGRKAVPPVIAAGFTVVGFDSMAFFDQPRTAPQLARWIAQGAAGAGVPRTGPIWIGGQSFGADVLPAALPLLPPPLAARIRGVALVVPATTRVWQISLSERLGLVAGEPAIAEGKAAAARYPLMCLRGAEETDSLCPYLAGPQVTQTALPGGHYLNRDTDAMGAALEAWLVRQARPDTGRRAD